MSAKVWLAEVLREIALRLYPERPPTVFTDGWRVEDREVNQGGITYKSLKSTEPKQGGWNEAIAAKHKNAVLESVVFICNTYANEGDRAGKEYVHETVAELVARFRALQASPEPIAAPQGNAGLLTSAGPITSDKHTLEAAAPSALAEEIEQGLIFMRRGREFLSAVERQQIIAALKRQPSAGTSQIDALMSLRQPEGMRIKPTHEAADAFWHYWKAYGETHIHGYYESTWGAINAALAAAAKPSEPSGGT